VVGNQVTYLDTHAVAALYQGDLSLFSPAALRVIDEEDDLRISPMVLLELEYLHEIKRIKVPARRIVDSLAAEIGLKICNASFPDVARKALEERWTRDPFDRIIVAQARLHAARLVTKDRLLRSRYPHAL
jgi:PIN domain nuclease of toxin-antitoxin system